MWQCKSRLRIQQEKIYKFKVFFYTNHCGWAGEPNWYFFTREKCYLISSNKCWAIFFWVSGVPTRRKVFMGTVMELWTDFHYFHRYLHNDKLNSRCHYMGISKKPCKSNTYSTLADCYILKYLLSKNHQGCFFGVTYFDLFRFFRIIFGYIRNLFRFLNM